jgi:hypothetical protein
LKYREGSGKGVSSTTRVGSLVGSISPILDRYATCEGTVLVSRGLATAAAAAVAAKG